MRFRFSKITEFFTRFIIPHINKTGINLRDIKIPTVIECMTILRYTIFPRNNFTSLGNEINISDKFIANIFNGTIARFSQV
ncbi:hypothetical protein Cocul_02068 [Corynebacterium oculi]|uniref:Uncharacterized protein n=1 Tax=Corynebacterium oculi TaxID=1544416 RepID=A0A0Q1DSR8_9CORY|nr:hypothetical protein Cocul_02068 [Corynebacterium oculi]